MCQALIGSPSRASLCLVSEQPHTPISIGTRPRSAFLNSNCVALDTLTHRCFSLPSYPLTALSRILIYLSPQAASPTMIILDEKMSLPPPPPYAPPEPVSPPPFPYQSRVAPTLPTLPPHILLHIVYATFGSGETIEKQRKVLYWLNTSLRAVCRTFYVGE